MVCNSEISEALKKREKELTYVSGNVSQKRSVYYFWDIQDEQAAEYCKELKEQELGSSTPIRLSSEYTLEDWISTYMKTVKESVFQDALQHKVYCLFITSDAARFDGKAFADMDDPSFELYYQLLVLGTELQDNVSKNHFNISWIVNPKDILVAKILMTDAYFSSEWILPGTWGFEIGGGWYRLRSARYSSIADNICGQLYYMLAPAFKNQEEAELEAELVRIYNAMFHCVKEVYQECPNAKYLPLPGYHELVEVLWPNGRKMAGHIRIYEAARIFFGKEREEPRPEWLRRQVLKYLPAACADNIRAYEKELCNQLFRWFSLDDLYGRAAGIALDCAERHFRLCKGIDEEISDILNKAYSASDSGICHVWNGFEQYLNKWDRYVREYLVGTWLAEVSKYIVILSKRNREDFDRLKRAYNSFKDYRDFSEENVLPAQDIFHYSDLLRAISQCSAHMNYSDGMLPAVRRRAAELYLGTGDDVAAEKRPKIGVIVSDKLMEDTHMIYDSFEWRYHPRAYMPENIIYELRMYKVYVSH